MNQHHRIFIGDRASLHLTSVQRALALQGHACHFAHDFAQAAALIGSEAWDIALVNPEVFGAETFPLCRALRGSDATGTLEIAFLASAEHESGLWATHALTAIQACVRIRRSRLDLREQIAGTLVPGQVDPLTGLFAPERLQRIAKTEAAQAAKQGAPLSLLAIRLKNADAIFAAGGPAGLEAALRQMAALFHAGTRGVDFLARVGEREFTLLAPQTGEAHLERVARRLRDALQQHPLIADDTVFSLEAAFGLASLAPGETDEAAMVLRARAALDAPSSGSSLQPATAKQLAVNRSPRAA